MQTEMKVLIISLLTLRLPERFSKFRLPEQKVVNSASQSVRTEELKEINGKLDFRLIKQPMHICKVYERRLHVISAASSQDKHSDFTGNTFLTAATAVCFIIRA